VCDEPLHSDGFTRALKSGDLINGLAADGLVSTEDRCDTSEHDAPLDFGAQQGGQSYENSKQGYDHEAYSIMPTTYGDDQKHDQHQQQSVSEPIVRDVFCILCPIL